MILQRAECKQMQENGKKITLFVVFCKCDKCQYTWIHESKKMDGLPARCARKKGCTSPFYWNKEGVDKSKENA